MSPTYLVTEMMRHELAPGMAAVVHQTLERRPDRLPACVAIDQLQKAGCPLPDHAFQLQGHL